MPPSETSKAGEEPRESEPGAESAGGSGASLPVDVSDESAALLADLTVGTVVDGKYRIDQVLGRGAMGVVVAATHVELGERVALKFLKYRSKGPSDDFRSRFKREAKVSARLKNEHITRVIDVGVWREHLPYMVMDYLDGTDLRQLLKANGPLQIGQGLDYIVQVCEGIAEAHAAGIVHRDLKPSNLFVTRRPDGSDLVKILDFGISKWGGAQDEIEELTQTGVVLGSPKYMAPEQLFGSAEVDARADVWSIGAILYELLTGRPPFDLPTFTKICAELSTDRPPPRPSVKRAEITPELEAVMLRCFARDPAQRTQSVAELAGDLLDAVQAPFAEPMRQKIASTLAAAKGGREALGITGSGGFSPLSSGTYGSVSSTSGKMRVAGANGSPASSSGESHAIPAAAAEAPARGSKATLGVVVALAAAGAVAYFALGGRLPAALSPAPAAQPPSASAATVPVATTTEAPPPSASASASAAPEASASAAPQGSASAVAAAPPPAPSAPPRSVHQGWRPPSPAPHPQPAATTTAPPTSQPVATAAPTATQAPPATTPKPDPLGDRQ